MKCRFLGFSYLALGFAGLVCAGAHADPIIQSFAPAQGGQILYNASGVTITGAYAHPNLLTVLGRNPSTAAGIDQAAEQGGIVAVYLDAVTQLSTPSGVYDAMFHGDSVCGPAIPSWPGTGTSYGVGADVRVSYFGSKLACVVEHIHNDFPQVNAIFLDDYGPGWTGYPDDSYRCQAVTALGKAFDQLRALNLHLLYFVNAMWHKTESCSAGGGWPNRSMHGLAGALPVWEHHSATQGSYAQATFDGPDTQWLKDATGHTGTFAITLNSSDTAYYAAQPWVGWVAQQTDDQYGSGVPTPTKPAHAIGLSFDSPFGRTATDDASSTGQVQDRLRASKVSLTKGGVLRTAAIYLDGQGGSPGTQTVRLALYRDNGGVPGALVAVGDEFTVQASDVAMWRYSAFPAANVGPGTYWLAEFTGPTGGVSRNHGSTNVSNYAAANAPYSAGAPSTFPPSSTGTIELDAFLTLQ